MRLTFAVVLALCGCSAIPTNNPFGKTWSPGMAGDIDKTRNVCVQMMRDGREVTWEEDVLPCHDLNEWDDRPTPARYDEEVQK